MNTCYSHKDLLVLVLMGRKIENPLVYLSFRLEQELCLSVVSADSVFKEEVHCITLIVLECTERLQLFIFPWLLSSSFFWVGPLHHL